MVTVTKLAHVGFRAKNLSNKAEFYNDRWGLEPVDAYGSELFFRADGPDHHVLIDRAKIVRSVIVLVG